jgi:hypothetical protein
LAAAPAKSAHGSKGEEHKAGPWERTPSHLYGFGSLCDPDFGSDDGFDNPHGDWIDYGPAGGGGGVHGRPRAILLRSLHNKTKNCIEAAFESFSSDVCDRARGGAYNTQCGPAEWQVFRMGADVED